MKRLMVYPGAIPLETDLLNIQRNTMISLSKLMEVLLGTSSTILHGLGCGETTPASMQVGINPGQIYATDVVDVSAFSSLAADIDHIILKQGLLMDGITLSCPAPVTIGHSINYLIQVTFQEVDETPVVLPYYNASNPAVAYTGPANTGVAQNTIRTGKCIVSVKAGASATTGIQSTPAVDVGYTAIYVITVDYGQTAILDADIVQVLGAPFYGTQFKTISPLIETTLTMAHKNVFVASPVPIHLPTYSTVLDDKEYFIKNNSDGEVIIDAVDGKLIDGAVSITLPAPGDRCRVGKDGTNWQTF